MFDRIKRALARYLSPAHAPGRTASRMYAMGRPSRLTEGWGTGDTSEDTELLTSLRKSRSRSRQLVRDGSYAKRAKAIVQNNVVGSGIGLQAKVETTRGQLNQRINDDIEAQWEEWMEPERSHTGGCLHFSDLERVLIGQVFEAGEVFVRLHRRRFGDSRVPLALEVIESERIADELQPIPVTTTAKVRLGVEIDAFHRPVAYWIRNIHPGEMRMTYGDSFQVERVPAEDIIHLRIIERWPQTRAIPWMHAAARKLNDMDGLTEAEITAARGAACYMGFIETPDGDSSYGDDMPDGSQQAELEPAIVEKLNPGEKFNFAAPNRPNSQLDPFMRMMLREVAAGTGTSYESLSRDYSQSNYSSSRLALLDDRDLWRSLQHWFIRSFRCRVHKIWLHQAVLAGVLRSIGIGAYATDARKFEAVGFKPRGWSWVDPTKEVNALKEAVRCGFTTVSDVIAQTGNGRDLEDILTERKREMKLMAEAGLMFDTDPSLPSTATTTAKNQAEPPPPDTTDGGAPTDPSVATAEKMLRQAGKGI